MWDSSLPAIGKIPADDQWNLLLVELFDRNLQRICFSFQVYQNGCIHAEIVISYSSDQCLAGATHLICSALVPSTLALSYLVMYGVVVRLSSGIFLSLSLVGFDVLAPASLVTLSLSASSCWSAFRCSRSASSGRSATAKASSSSRSSGS